MATITEKTKGNKVISFKFHCCVGRDEQGKQHFRTTTWKPPEGLSYAKARKMAEAEAYRWEQEIKGNTEGQGVYTSPLPVPCEAVQVAEEVLEKETFRYFAEQVWMPLKVIAGGARPSTIAMYGFMMRVSLPRLGDKRLKDITAVDIMRYLQYLREEYRAPDGRTLSEKSIKHHYDILRIIFNYAEKQEAIEKNPIKKVDAPKTVKRPVEALTQEQAKIFFRALNGCKLEYGDTFGSIRSVEPISWIQFRRETLSPRNLAEASNDLAYWAKVDDILPVCFNADLTTRTVAGHDCNPSLYFVYPVENGRSVLNESEATFYAGEYEFSEADPDEAKAAFDDLTQKLTQIYGEPHTAGNSLDGVLGEGSIPEDRKQAYAEQMEFYDPSYAVWVSTANNAVLVLKYYKDGESFARTKLDYISLDAADIFAQIDTAAGGASAVNSTDGL